jgi:hypothetical protein
MSENQKQKAEPYPNFPPTPPYPKVRRGEISNIPTPPDLQSKKSIQNDSLNEYIYYIKAGNGQTIDSLITQTGFTKINGETTFYSTVNDNTKYYNRWGVEIDKNGNKVNGDKQVESDDVVLNQNIHKVYKDNKVVSIFKIKNGHQQNIPEPPMPPIPPKPESYEDHINRVSKDYDVTFFFENRKISKSEALKLLKKYKKLNMSSHIDNGKGTVHFSKKGTTIKK